jgi:hypothetical protein
MSAARIRSILLDAMNVHKEMQKIRFRLARAMMQRLAQMRSRPSVIEVNGYQTYVWVPEHEAKEYRVEPVTLTGGVTGWLATRNYAPGRIIDVDWGDVYASLRPTFTYSSRILDSVRSLLSIFTDIALEQYQIAPEAFDGAVNINEHSGWYRIDVEGIKVMYISQYVEEDGRVRANVVEDYITTTSCGFRAVLKGLLYQATNHIRVVCPNGSEIITSYFASECGALDQMVTYVRQLLDKQIHCPRLALRNVAFVSGPLMGLTWPEDPTNKIIAWDGQASQVVDVSEVAEAFVNAVRLCEQTMAAILCTNAQPVCEQGTECLTEAECAERQGTCVSACPHGGAGMCCCRIEQQ